MTVTAMCIRWDAWYADTGSAQSTARALSDADYLYRAPFWARLINRAVKFEPTQETMTREIAEAAAAGVGWAFLRYGDTSTMNAGWDLFQANPNKNAVKWCSMITADVLANGAAHPSSAWEARAAQIVGWMQQPNYHTVLANRPVLYLFYLSVHVTNWWGGADVNLKVAIDGLRSAAAAANLEDPYIVVMAGDPVNAEARRVALGADAISAYISLLPAGLNKTYASLATATETFWAQQRDATSAHMVPTAMIGINPAPRRARPVPWEAPTQRPYFGMADVHEIGTPAEVAAHVSDAIDFVNATAKCAAATMLIYAWNEFDEGGWLCPTLGDTNGERLAAFGAVINGQP